jgi:hypothetical protein
MAPFSVGVFLFLAFGAATLASVSHVHAAVDYTLKAKTVDLGDGLPPVMARELEQDILTAVAKKAPGGKFGFAARYITIYAAWLFEHVSVALTLRSTAFNPVMT